MEPPRYVGMKCLKLALYAISITQLIIACLMIIGGASINILFRHYHFTTWYPSLHNLPNLWIATGCFLVVFSAFGIYATLKRSTKLMNSYAVSLTLVFILQVAAAITGFALLPHTGRIVRSSLDSLMGQYSYNYRYRDTIDWIQETFQCCGNQGPSDWYPILDYPPQSCCEYDNIDYCNNRHSAGCHSVLYDMVFRSILLIASSALVFGLLQIWGIICAVFMASKIRQSKTQRDVQRWTTFQKTTLQNPFEEKIRPEELRDGDINYM